MTNAELNRDWKRLYKKYQNNLSVNNNLDKYYGVLENEIKPEFRRLYHADSMAESVNENSLRIMVALNLSLRVINLHMFLIGIKIKS